LPAAAHGRRCVVAMLLQSPHYTRVHALSRRPLPFDHPRLANRVVRFEASLQAQLKGLQVRTHSACLGTTDDVDAAA